MARGYKTGGRGRGTQNKVTKQLRERISDFLEENWPKIEEDFHKLDAKERTVLFERLLQYTIPKLQATELKAPEGTGEIIIIRKVIGSEQKR